MTGPLQRIVYYSKNLLTGPDEEIAASIEEILEKARVNNTKANLTGALIFNSGCFAQVLEGPRDCIAEIFERIQCDPRHTEVQVLEYEPANERTFPNWSMAFIGVREKDERLFNQLALETGFDDKRLAAEDILTAMREIMMEEEGVSV
ncbi:BLUF domain-containing protein [Hyphomicrobium sp. 99]|uniref:BLUF domain-containing protein n=1 Tax=Hyphomicrobium sp. 99 TaxID=1163419 RepID=UPI0005F875B9|nr:BLUF domain-containing protein [Hyphomicrobium sp. 99]